MEQAFSDNFFFAPIYVIFIIILLLQIFIVKNQTTMDKSLSQELRQEFFPSQSKKQDHSFDHYINILTSKGLKINKSIFPSYFQLKNGLLYPGIATREQIGDDQQLVRVPNQLVLTTLKALQCVELKQIYQQKFYHYAQSWEDRILCTFALFLYQQKDQNNVWYQMIKHLPKQIDILCFWPQQQLDKFKDLTVKSAAMLDLQSFQSQWKQFQEVQKKYQILRTSVFTKQNYCWIFIHLNSRCFGKHVQFTSMVPFCQFFNHHCSSVYYTVEPIKAEEKQRPQEIKQKQSSKQTTINKQNAQSESISSQGSYQSQDYIQIGEFAYDQMEEIPFKWECKECFNLKIKEKQQILLLAGSLLDKIQQQINWTDFTILFVGHLIQRTKLIQNQYLSGRKPYEKALGELKLIELCLENYRIKIIDFYKTIKGQKYQYKCVKNVKTKQNQNKNIIVKNKEKQTAIFPTCQKNHYENFLLKTFKRDKFLPNNQVYFCYGKNSNRTLLLRYGFAILGNKYQHVWMSFDIVGALIGFPDTLSKIQDKLISLRRKFKICHNRLNMEIIMFFRLNSWYFYGLKSIDQLFNIKDASKELAILDQLKQMYVDKIQLYEDEYDLSKPSLNYHEYFIQTYHIQKINILKKQIQYLSSIMKGLQSLQKGMGKQKSFSHLSEKEAHIMRHYLKMI